MPLIDGDLELPIAVDQGEGAIGGGVGIGAEEGKRGGLALDGDAEELADLELA